VDFTIARVAPRMAMLKPKAKYVKGTFDRIHLQVLLTIHVAKKLIFVDVLLSEPEEENKLKKRKRRRQKVKTVLDLGKSSEGKNTFKNCTGIYCMSSKLDDSGKLKLVKWV
jgi:hypothetical protein